MALTLREVKGSALTIQEMDDNFRYFTGSHSITGSLIVSGAVTASFFSGNGSGLTGVTGDWDGSLNGNASITGSLIVTAGVTASLLGNVVGNVTGNVTGTATTASYVVTAQTASYVNAANVDGTVTNAATASYVTTAQTASFFDVVNYVAGLGEYADDAAAATGGVPVGGLYKNGNFIQIRIV